MLRWVPIVEGHGEVTALPTLLRRLAYESDRPMEAEIATPIRVKRDRFLNKPDEFRRMLLLARAKAGSDGRVLILLDADDDCPAQLGPKLMADAAMVAPDVRCSVVLANREFEAWFIAAAASLNGHRGFQLRPGDDAQEPEIPRDAKGWMGNRMTSGYGETTDQVAFTAVLDLDMARQRSRSFQKLCKDFFSV